MVNSSKNLTGILSDQKLSNESKIDLMFENVYAEIKKIAWVQLKSYNCQSTVSATQLVNECYMKLRKSSKVESLSTKHFYFITSRCMKFFLIDQIRKNFAQKNQGHLTEFTSENDLGIDDDHINVLELNHALSKLESANPEFSQIIELKFFGGYSFEEIAMVLEYPLSTLYNKWLMAKSVLLNLLDDGKK